MWGGGGHYNAWASFLEQWSAGAQVDPAALPQLSREDFTGDSWERLTYRLTDALSRRLTMWAAGLTRGLAEARDEFGVSRALAHARSGLLPIRAMAAHPALPPDLATRLRDLVDEQVRSAQKSLENQVESMRRAGTSRAIIEARLRTIRDNALTVVIDEGYPHRPGRGSDGWAVDPATQSRRRVILD